MDKETILRLESTVVDAAGRKRKRGDMRCGTAAGHRRHQAADEEPCALCKIAKAAYDLRNRDIPENKLRNRLSAQAQMHAHTVLHSRYPDEYTELYTERKRLLFEAAGLTYTKGKSRAQD